MAWSACASECPSTAGARGRPATGGRLPAACHASRRLARRTASRHGTLPADVMEATSGTFTFLLSDIEGSTVACAPSGRPVGRGARGSSPSLRAAFEQAGGQGHRHPGRRVLRCVPQAEGRGLRGPGRAALASRTSVARGRAAFASAWASTPARHPSPTASTTVWPSIGRHGSAPPATVATSCVPGDVRAARRRGARRFDVHVARPRRAEPQGLRAPCAPIPVGRRGDV